MKKVSDPIAHEAQCLANELLLCVEALVKHPCALTIRRVSDELDGWASCRADRAERDELPADELTNYDPRTRRAELMLRILEVS